MKLNKILPIALAAMVVVCGVGATNFSSKVSAVSGSGVDVSYIIEWSSTPSEVDAVDSTTYETITNPTVTKEPGSYVYTAADGTPQTRAVSTMGVAVAGAQEVLPQGSVFESKEISKSSAEFTTAATTVESQVPNATVGAVMEYDIYSAGVQVSQLDGYVTVTVPIPAGLIVGEGQVIAVYRVNTDGTVTRCETTYNSYQVQFTTNHFSTYAFVVESATNAATTSTSSSTTSSSPKTGEE